jgi:radical SAM protein with 4Fe4S-binding SPASM domain
LNEKTYLRVSSFHSERRLTHIDIEVTKKCNLSCTHCSAESNRTGKELSLNEMKTIFDNAYSSGLEEIGFTGGEPLLRRRKMITLLKYCKESLAKKTHVHTNGTLLESEDARILASLADETTVTILGSKSQTHDHVTSIRGSHENTERALRYLLSQGANVRTYLVPLKSNYREIPNIVRKASELGCRKFRVLSLSPTGRARDNYPSMSVNREETLWLTSQLMKAKHELGISIDAGFCTRQDYHQLDSLKGHQACFAGENRVHIDAFGEVFPCTAASGVQQFSLGSLREHEFDLSHIWKSSPLLQFLRYFHSNPPSRCKVCQVYQQCMGGCRVMMHYKYGDITATRKDCKLLTHSRLRPASGN